MLSPALERGMRQDQIFDYLVASHINRPNPTGFRSVGLFKKEIFKETYTRDNVEALKSAIREKFYQLHSRTIQNVTRAVQKRAQHLLDFEHLMLKIFF